jgi:predicted O-linked N-acetylglucosamine transferase (SPINDLY family)
MTGDAKQHSVAYFMDALLRYADKSRFEVFLYRNVSKGDELTKRFVAMAEHDRVLTGLNEEGAARLMRKDGIDVLIDLSGLTSGSGVWMLRSRVAPVQGNYLGYCNTTGIPRCDVRFVDDVTDPAPWADALATERLVRIPGGFLCYRPDDKLPASVDWQAQPGALRLACFNAMHKWSSATYDLWARVLREVPGAALTLKAKPIDDPGVRAWVRGQFASRGVAEDRVELLGRTQGQGDHLSMYNRVDVALDPFPYNGTTTTCELLTMGVPMITLVGDRHCARVGASINTMVGVPELNAQTPDDYVRIARELADNPARLAGYRTTLRARTLASPLCDGPGFVGRIEAQYARLWQEWCEGRQVGNVP